MQPLGYILKNYKSFISTRLINDSECLLSFEQPSFVSKTQYFTIEFVLQKM
jgi:hypothetical protein